MVNDRAEGDSELTSRAQSEPDSGGSLADGKAQLRLAFGNCETSLNTLFAKAIEKEYDGRYDVVCVSTDSIDDLTRLGKEDDIDLFIVIANNVRAPSSGEDRLTAVVGLVSFLKKTCRKPVIAMSGFPDSSLSKRFADAGADAFFQLPFGREPFVEAVKAALAGR